MTTTMLWLISTESSLSWKTINFTLLVKVMRGYIYHSWAKRSLTKTNYQKQKPKSTWKELWLEMDALIQDSATNLQKMGRMECQFISTNSSTITTTLLIKIISTLLEPAPSATTQMPAEISEISSMANLEKLWPLSIISISLAIIKK